MYNPYFFDLCFRTAYVFSLLYALLMMIALYHTECHFGAPEITQGFSW